MLSCSCRRSEAEKSKGLSEVSSNRFLFDCHPEQSVGPAVLPGAREKADPSFGSRGQSREFLCVPCGLCGVGVDVFREVVKPGEKRKGRATKMRLSNGLCNPCRKWSIVEISGRERSVFISRDHRCFRHQRPL